MTGKKNRMKRFIVAGASLMMITCSMEAAYARPLFYDPELGVGFEVFNPTEGLQSRSITEGERVTVSGGTLWASWNNSNSTFRANYYHGSKTHGCSATNDHGTVVRSSWVPAGYTAVSPWLDQTLSNNKVWAATEP